MLLFDSIAGSPFFYRSSRELVAQTFPEFAIRPIPLDHPLFHMLYDVHNVKYPRGVKSKVPHLDGIYVGSRLGVIISRYGLGCGWDDRDVPLLPRAAYYDVESANKLGLNIMAYAIGYAGAAREEAKPELFGVLDEKAPTDEFVFAQIRHEGAWNVHPGAAAALLRRMRQNTAVRVSLKRVPVTPGKDDLAPYSFLYLTGLDTFSFDEAAVAALRRFLAHAGTLVVNNGLGLSSFDKSFRRELRKILPESELQPLAPGHPVFSSVFPVHTATYTPAVKRLEPKLTTPRLEGITLEGDLRVIYSPFDLEAAWLACEYPLARAYASQSGTQLGMNVIVYAMTH
jgi:hypothetical protein